MATTEVINWTEISEKLRQPFDPREVDFRVQGRANESTGRAQVVAYVDARAVQDRLDAVVGAGAWAFDWEPLIVDKGEVQVAKGTITIHGVSKADAGSASNFEQSLGAVSHCFKRAAVHWGIGRYLYNLPMAWVTVEKGGRIPEQVLRELRAKLPRPAGSVQPSQPAQAAQEPQAAQEATPQAEAAPVPAQRAQERKPAPRPAPAPALAPAAEQAQQEPEPAQKVRSWAGLRKRALDVGYEVQSEWEDLVRDVTGKGSGWKNADYDAVEQRIAGLEKEMQAALALAHSA